METQIATQTTTKLPMPLPEIPVATLPDEKQQHIARILEKISLDTPGDVLYYGIEAQRKMSGMAEKIIGDTKAKDAGPVGELLNSMLIEIKDLKIDNLQPGGNFLSRLPLIGGLFDELREFIGKYESVASKIDQTANALERESSTMLRSVQSLESLYNSNIEQIQDLEVYIEAGKRRLAEFAASFPNLRDQAQASGNPMEVQKVNDLAANANRLEKRLYDLAISRQLGIQTAPTLRMMQHSAAELAEKIQSSLLLTIPLWKQQMAVGIELFRQKKAVELQQKLSDTTNDLLKKNAELLHEGQVAIARESERAIVDIDTLKHTQSNLISTIEEVIRIHEEGKQARVAGLGEIERMEEDLKTKLMSLQTGV